MDFRKRELPTTPAMNTEPPFVFTDESGKEIRIPMETFRQLPQERKEFFMRKQLAGNSKENNKKGEYPARPAYGITVVVEDCKPEDLNKVTEVAKSCPAKMTLHEDYRLPINTYIARYFILNGDEQKNIEDHWLASVPSVQFKVEVENGLTEIHRRSIIDGKYGERMETKPMVPGQIPQPGPAGPVGGMSFNPRSDMHKLAKPCAGCGKNRYSAPSFG